MEVCSSTNEFQSVGPQAKRARGSGPTRASSRGPHRPTSRGGFSAQNRLDQLRSGQQGTSPSSESNGTLQNGGYTWVRNESGASETASDSSCVGGAKFATPRGQSKRPYQASGRGRHVLTPGYSAQNRLNNKRSGQEIIRTNEPLPPCPDNTDGGADEAESGPQRPPGSRDGVQGQRGREGRRGGGGRGLSARDMNQRDSNHNVQVVDKPNPYKIDRRPRTVSMTSTSSASATLVADPSFEDPNCICLRQLKRVYCGYCGHYEEGRLKRACPVHPSVCYLLDMSNCPQCKVSHRFLNELDFPAGCGPTKTNFRTA